MKGEDIVGLVVGLLLIVFFSVTISYISAHSTAYNKGIEQARIYYEATGAFPSKVWISRNEDERHKDTTDIIESLKEFEEIK